MAKIRLASVYLPEEAHGEPVAKLLQDAGGGFDERNEVEGPFTYLRRSLLIVGNRYRIWLTDANMRDSWWVVKLSSMTSEFTDGGVLKFTKIQPVS